ncbi:hypothetical protein P3809_16320 [Pseudomonas aeruginosa]|nr:hypothetical protein [Pseudomonas aeruginosa]
MIKMAKRIKFEDLLPIYRTATKQSDGNYLLDVSNGDVKQSLEAAVDELNSDDSGISVLKGNFEEIRIGDQFLLSLSPPRTGMGILANDFSQYLLAPEAKIKERKFYYLLDSHFFSRDKPVPEVVNKYRMLLRLVSILAESAYYLDSSKEELVFYRNGRFIVPVNYSEEEVSSFNVESFEKIERLMVGELHKEQKLKILGETLVAMLDGVESGSRFKHILINIEDFYSKFLIGYNIFAADFTYEKAVAEIHAFKVDVITRAHKAITDIQAQILGIPIATFIALSQIKKTVSLNSQFAANSIIFLGVIIFCVLLAGFLFNQKTTLNTICCEVARQKEVFKKKFNFSSEIYGGEFKVIEDRLSLQYGALICIATLDALMFSCGLVYYVVFTRPIYNVLF